MHSSPLKQFRALSHILGRREALKYTGIAIAAGMVAPLTGCSGSKVAFAEFAAGTWTVTFPERTLLGDVLPEGTFVIDEGGTWRFSGKSVPQMDSVKAAGTWKLEDFTLMLEEQEQAAGDGYVFLPTGDSGDVHSETYAATTIPDEVDEDKMIPSFTWAIKAFDEGDGGSDSYRGWRTDTSDFSVVWEAATKTLTLASRDGEYSYWGNPIIAKKSGS